MQNRCEGTKNQMPWSYWTEKRLGERRSATGAGKGKAEAHALFRVQSRLLWSTLDELGKALKIA